MQAKMREQRPHPSLVLQSHRSITLFKTAAFHAIVGVKLIEHLPNFLTTHP
jgi:hypothetical protein